MQIKLTRKTIILLICCALILVLGLVISAVKRQHQEPTTPGVPVTDDSKDPQHNQEDLSFLQGDWYSTREKGDHLVLNADGTMSSEWLGRGTYQYSGNTLTLIGTLNLTVTLQYDAVADTLFFSGNIREDSHTYYHSEELLRSAVEAQREADATSDDVKVARELLTSGPWEAAAGGDVFMRVSFTDNTIAYNYYLIDSEKLYDYSIERANMGSGELTVFIAYADHDDPKGTLKEATIVIRTSGDGQIWLRENGLGFNTDLFLQQGG